MGGMNGPRRTVTRVVGWVVAGVLAVAAASAVGVAFAGSSGTGGTGEAAGAGLFAAVTDSPSASPSSGAPDRPKPGRPGHGGLFGHGRLGAGVGQNVLHGEFVVKDKDGKVTTMVAQHGSVTAVSATSISLKSDDGFTGTYAVNNDTRVRVGGGPGAITGVKTGNEAWVIATKGGTSTAKILIVRD
jgi:hypothetical protein